MKPDIVLTAVFGADAERLDRTFTSFARHTGAKLHALVVGEALPGNRVTGVHYHLVPPDPDFGPPDSLPRTEEARRFQLHYRNACYRRWEIMDELDAEFCLVVDGNDVLCLQPLPPMRDLLRGAAVAACVEHVGHYYLSGQGYTSNFLNAGVTFWNVARSKTLRKEILDRGRSAFRDQGDDQWAFNEVVQTRHSDDLVILPCQFNYRPFLGPPRRGWPTVTHLDGVRIYHNRDGIEQALALGEVRREAELRDPGAPVPVAETALRLRRPWRRVRFGTNEDGSPRIAE